MTQGGLGVADTPKSVEALHDPAVAVVGAQGVAAGGDVVDDLLEVLPGQVAVGAGADDLVVEIDQVERLGTRAAHDVLGQDIQGAGALGLAVERVLGDGLAGGLALQHLEAVGRHEEGVAGFVQAMVGPADALDHARGALGRGQLDDQVHVAPVDAEVEGGGADHCAKLTPRHGGLDLAPLFGRERAVVQGDGQAVVVELP